MSLVGQYPALEQSSPGRQKWKPLLDRKGKQSLGPRLDESRLPTVLVKQRSKAQNRGHGVGVRQFVGQGDRVLDFLQGLVRVANVPQNQSQILQSARLGVV